MNAPEPPSATSISAPNAAWPATAAPAPITTPSARLTQPAKTVSRMVAAPSADHELRRVVLVDVHGERLAGLEVRDRRQRDQLAVLDRVRLAARHGDGEVELHHRR